MLDETSMAALLEVFLAETEEGLEAAEEALLVLERNPDDEEALALVFRMVHTIKGNAGVFDFHCMAAVAHAMEDVLDRIRARKTVVSQDVVSTLLEAVDVGQRRAQRPEPLVRAAPEHRQRQLFLVGEVGVDRPRRVARLVRDLPDGGPVQALPAEQPLGGVEQVLAGLPLALGPGHPHPRHAVSVVDCHVSESR